MGIRYSNAVFLVLSAGVLTLLVQAAAAQQRGGPGLVGPGAVRGYVLDEAGKAVVGARVSISQALPPGVARTAAPPVITGPQITASVTDAKGQFLAALPAGNYVACASAATPGLLNPCHWAASAPVFSVAAGQSTVTPNIVMAKGAIIPIHVDDPLQLLAPAVGPFEMDCRFQVVTAKGYRYDAAIVGHGNTSRDYAITVPFGTPLTLQILSPHLLLNDSTGKPVASAGTSIVVPAGASPQPLNHTVSGVKP